MQGYTTVGILHTVLTLYPIGGGGGAGLEKNFWTYSSCGASGLNFSLVLTPDELVLKSGI